MKGYNSRIILLNAVHLTSWTWIYNANRNGPQRHRVCVCGTLKSGVCSVECAAVPSAERAQGTAGVDTACDRRSGSAVVTRPRTGRAGRVITY